MQWIQKCFMDMLMRLPSDVGGGGGSFKGPFAAWVVAFGI